MLVPRRAQVGGVQKWPISLLPLEGAEWHTLESVFSFARHSWEARWDQWGFWDQHTYLLIGRPPARTESNPVSHIPASDQRLGDHFHWPTWCISPLPFLLCLCSPKSSCCPKFESPLDMPRLCTEKQGRSWLCQGFSAGLILFPLIACCLHSDLLPARDLCPLCPRDLASASLLLKASQILIRRTMRTLHCLSVRVYDTYARTHRQARFPFLDLTQALTIPLVLLVLSS